MDFRELYPDPEEASRAMLDGLRKRIYTALPVQVHEDSADGHTVTLKSTVKGYVTDKDGKVTHVELPIMGDVPIFHSQGGKNVSTNPITKGMEGIILFSSRPLDIWHQFGDIQNAVDTRQHSLSDGMFFPGIRSDPRKLQAVSTDSQQHRSEDGKQTVDVHPEKGVTTKAVDPSEPAASESHSPFKDAKKYHQSKAHPTEGIEHKAQSEDTQHRVTVDHDNGSRVMAENDKHVFGASLAGLKAITEKTFQIASKLGTTLTGGLGADKGAFGLLSMRLPSGGFFGLNTDGLGGDLEGPLPNPKVIGCRHIRDAHLLPHFASELDAQAGGIKQGYLFRTGPQIMVNTLPDPEA